MKPVRTFPRSGVHRTFAVSFLSTIVAVTAGFAAMPAAEEADDGFAAAVRRDTESLSRYPSRAMGSPGYADAQDWLLREILNIPGVEVHLQEFPVTVPTVQRAELTVEGAVLPGIHRIYPVWPDLVRLKTTPTNAISGRLVYVGSGRAEDLPARSLRGQIAVMEMRDYHRWRAPFAMGAAALILLGGPDDAIEEPAQQALYKPRYYIPAGPLVDALRNGRISSACIDCDASWRTVTARTILAAVAPAIGTPTLDPIALVAPYDAMSVIQGLAPGADNALDAAFLLNWLRRTAAHPPARPILFAFVDAYGINQRGIRELFLMLTATVDNSTRQEYEKLNNDLLEKYRGFATQVNALGSTLTALEGLHDRRKYRDIQRYLKDVVSPEVINLREDTSNLRLERHRATGDVKEAIEREIERQETRLRFLSTMLSQILTKEPLEERFSDEAMESWQHVRNRVVDQLAGLEQDNDYYERMDGLREALHASLGVEGGKKPAITFVLGIDLSDAATKIGPALHCQHLETSESTTARSFLHWLKPLVRGGGALYDEDLLRRAVSTDAILGLETPLAYNPSRLAMLTSPASSFGLQAVTWSTLDGFRPWLDSPQDLAVRLDWTRINPQLEFTVRMLTQMESDPAFAPAGQARHSQRPGWRHPRGTIVSESLAETVPRTPEPGMLVTYVLGSNASPGLPAAPGVRRNEFVRTGPDGRFRFPATAGIVGGSRRFGLVHAYVLDERGRIVRALSDSASMLAGRVSSSIDLAASPSATPVRSVSFECAELDGPLFFDPRFLEPLNQASLLDVQRGGMPKRFHFSVHEGQMFGLLVPGTRWQLIMRAGIAAKRMAIMNISPALLDGGMSLRAALGTGFAIDEPLPSIPSHVSARDFHTVDRWRRDQYAGAGIISHSINALLDDTIAFMTAADRALQRDDGAALQRAASGALANEIRAYEALQATADDVTRGAVFLMLLLVPFAAAMERLLFACAHIHRRIVAAISIFVVMTAILWSFHPAFRITTQPLIILLAFAILLLSLVVIIMIMRKFETDLKELRSGRAEASGAETSRGGVIGSAVWLGIANMRKRKLRTALTATTIILITFALLCFSSATTYQTRRELLLRGVESPYPGVLIRLPGMQRLAERAADVVDNLLQGGASQAARYWWTDLDPSWRLHAINPADGRQVSLKAALGLSANESRMTRPERFLPRWETFERDGGCYLSATVAGILGLSPGDPVLLAGRPLTLVGVFDAAKVSQEWRMLDGRPLLPYDFTVATEAGADQDTITAQLASGEGLQDDSETTSVSGDELIIVPAAMLKRVGTLRSIAVRGHDASDALEITESLMKVLSFPMYCSTPEGVKAMVTTPLIAKPPRNLLVPLIIAALIIFNTMLNSVAERKGEIHIYTSLGLAPRHIGVLFVAEALTYGLLGTISGYVLGQGLATILTHFDLMGGITLNYSGTSVVMTMGLVLLVVVLSAIVPAVMAGKLATPSKAMTWKVPEPENGVIRDLLPFTVTDAAAKGLVAFIYDYMDAHQEGSIGNFTADALQLLPAEGERVTGLAGTVWLAPYDLGVRQTFRIEVTFETGNICKIDIALVHGAGKTRTWWRLNKNFLADLRRQLLGWRRVPAERVMEYIRDAESRITSEA